MTVPRPGVALTTVPPEPLEHGLPRAGPLGQVRPPEAGRRPERYPIDDPAVVGPGPAPARRRKESPQAAGVSQEKLAELAGLHRTYVSTDERGLRNISLLNIEKLAVALGVPLADLMPPRAKPADQAPGPSRRPDRS